VPLTQEQDLRLRRTKRTVDSVNYADPTGRVPVWVGCGAVNLGWNGDGYSYAGLICEFNVAMGSDILTPVLNTFAEPVGSGGPGHDEEAQNLAGVSESLKRAAGLQTIFSAEQLDCISGIETGRNWDTNAVASNGRVGLFQFNQNSWSYSGTAIAWNGGQSAKDAYTAATVALALLTRNLGYDGVQNPTPAAVTAAIDKFGEHDGRFGQAVVDCAGRLAKGDFDGAIGVLQTYATWVAGGRR